MLHRQVCVGVIASITAVVACGRDGAPFDAEFLGAAGRDHGLITPCEATLPQVEQGRYEIEVLSIAAASGCGAADSEILFWTFMNDTQYFGTAALPWPADGAPTTF